MPEDVSAPSVLRVSNADPIGPRVDVEYEQETEPLSREMLKNW
jgi:hypothetical protein